MNVVKVFAFICVMGVVLGLSLAVLASLLLSKSVFMIALAALGLIWIASLALGTVRIHTLGRLF